MKYRDFQQTDIFKKSDIVIIKHKGVEVSPHPFDEIITAYPVIHPDYPHISTITAEIKRKGE